MKWDPWELDASVSPGEHTLCGRNTSTPVTCSGNESDGGCLAAVQMSMPLACCQHRELQKPCALWTAWEVPEAHAARTRREPPSGSWTFHLDSRITCSFFSHSVNWGVFLFFWAAVFNRRIGTPPIFLDFIAREAFAWLLFIYELKEKQNHRKRLQFLRWGRKSGAWGASPPVLMSLCLTTSWRDRGAGRWKSTGFRDKSRSTAYPLCDVWSAVAWCSPVSWG